MKKSSKPIPAIDTRRQCNCGECLMDHVDRALAGERDLPLLRTRPPMPAQQPVPAG